MRVETMINRIISSDKSDTVKMIKLWSLAAKQMPGSDAQNTVKSVWEFYFNKVHGGKAGTI